MKLLGLFIYPIKSCQGIALEKAEVFAQGLGLDRELMLVDCQGKFLTQRQYPQLAQVQVNLAANSLELFHPRSGQFTLVPTNQGMEVQVEVWRDRLGAIDQGEAIADWFQQVLECSESIRLVRQSSQHPRAIDLNYTQNEIKPVSFADGFPLLVTATASLNDLNQRLATKYQNEIIPMNRFRPNLVIETDIPFMESGWRQIQINQVILNLVKPCSRCIVITTDQQNGDRHAHQEPLKTLGSFRNVPQQGIMFGENAIPWQTGWLAIGDTVRLLS
ncbi:MAG: MOSC domain-containing protein [Microcystaceae cyanobacterium]